MILLKPNTKLLFPENKIFYVYSKPLKIIVTIVYNNAVIDYF